MAGFNSVLACFLWVVIYKSKRCSAQTPALLFINLIYLEFGFFLQLCFLKSFSTSCFVNHVSQSSFLQFLIYLYTYIMSFFLFIFLNSTRTKLPVSFSPFFYPISYLYRALYTSFLFVHFPYFHQYQTIVLFLLFFYPTAKYIF